MSTKRGLRRKSCQGKIQYETKAVAQLALRDLRRKGATGLLNVYPCKFGKHYHVGHRPRFRKRGTR